MGWVAHRRAWVAAWLLWGADAAAACVDYAAAPGRLVELEAAASRGALGAAPIACLEESFARSTEQTVKGKISRVLLVDAYVSDTARWAQLVSRHLTDVDQSDPDIAYLYALYLYHRDPNAHRDEVLRWSEVALDRKAAWTGQVYTARVNALLQVRALTALASWKAAEDAAVRDPAIRGAATEARNETKTLAREWLDFARSAGRDTRSALALCVSAGSAAACGEAQ